MPTALVKNKVGFVGHAVADGVAADPYGTCGFSAIRTVTNADPSAITTATPVRGKSL
jgi:hypothetical protein